MHEYRDEFAADRTCVAPSTSDVEDTFNIFYDFFGGFSCADDRKTVRV